MRRESSVFSAGKPSNVGSILVTRPSVWPSLTTAVSLSQRAKSLSHQTIRVLGAAGLLLFVQRHSDVSFWQPNTL